VCLVLSLAACDLPDGGPEDDPARDGRRDAAPFISATHAIAGAVQAEAHRSGSIAAEAVFLASQLAGAGQIVITGTLAQNEGGFTWAPQPTDRMVVAFGDDTTVDLWIDDIAGDSTTAATFLAGEHRLAYRVAVADRIDMAFASTRKAGAMTASADGTLVYEDVEYEVAIEMVGTYTAVRDQRETTGSIVADGFDLDVDETLVRTGGASTRSTQRTISSSLHLRSGVYDWVDVVTRTSVDSDWAAEGEILRNGSSWGAYRLGSTPFDDVVTIGVELPDGRLDLE
jgi:hypothetical protein